MFLVECEITDFIMVISNDSTVKRNRNDTKAGKNKFFFFGQS